MVVYNLVINDEVVDTCSLGVKDKMVYKDFADETLTVFGIIWDDYESYEEFFKRFETFF